MCCYRTKGSEPSQLQEQTSMRNLRGWLRGEMSGILEKDRKFPAWGKTCCLNFAIPWRTLACVCANLRFLAVCVSFYGHHYYFPVGSIAPWMALWFQVAHAKQTAHSLSLKKIWSCMKRVKKEVHSVIGYYLMTIDPDHRCLLINQIKCLNKNKSYLRNARACWRQICKICVNTHLGDSG